MFKPVHILTAGLIVYALQAAACTEREQSPDETGARSDRDAVTTLQQRQDLSTDLLQAERSLTSIEDSIRNFLGLPDAAGFEQARTLWDHYRKAECDAVRSYFEAGTIAPVAQLACLVALTDARRRLIAEQYQFIRPASPGE